ncbi:hypothetical protein Krac_3826 [Ktedonobacter racemifer DSM 44963]|uniref:Uncharacterized protein n=2 Tax=Ktedonobacter racemifer TaxID=363277 RepID=D6U326_KTERA|nr:hypothetical protein Krac_3826 [Ktedonobacter racemifer DSM 44963]
MSETACGASVKRRGVCVSRKREVAAENVPKEARNRLEQVTAQGAEMTPKHQEIIYTILQAIQARARLYHWALSQPPEEPFRTQSIEQMRASLLGQKLCWIAEYIEGYPAAVQPERREQEWGWRTVEIIGGMRREVYQVCSVVYGSLDRKTWSFPKGCQHTGLGGVDFVFALE